MIVHEYGFQRDAARGARSIFPARVGRLSLPSPPRTSPYYKYHARKSAVYPTLRIVASLSERCLAKDARRHLLSLLTTRVVWLVIIDRI